MKKYLPGVVLFVTFTSCKLTRSSEDSQNGGSDLASVGLNYKAETFPWAESETQDRKDTFLKNAVLKLSLKMPPTTDAKCKAPDMAEKSGEFDIKSQKFIIPTIQLSNNCNYFFDLKLVNKDKPSVVYFKQKDGSSNQAIVADKATKKAIVKLTLCVSSDEEKDFKTGLSCVDSSNPDDSTSVEVVPEFKGGSTSPQSSTRLNDVIDAVTAVLPAIAADQTLKADFAESLTALKQPISSTVEGSAAKYLAAYKNVESQKDLAYAGFTSDIKDKIAKVLAAAKIYIDLAII